MQRTTTLLLLLLAASASAASPSRLPAPVSTRWRSGSGGSGSSGERDGAGGGAVVEALQPEEGRRVVLVGTLNGNLTAVDLGDGSHLWSFASGPLLRGTPQRKPEVRRLVNTARGWKRGDTDVVLQFSRGVACALAAGH